MTTTKTKTVTKKKKPSTKKKVAKKAAPKGHPSFDMNDPAFTSAASERRTNGTSFKKLKEMYKLPEAKIKEACAYFDKRAAVAFREDKKMGLSLEAIAEDNRVSLENVKRLIAGKPLKWKKTSVSGLDELNEVLNEIQPGVKAVFETKKAASAVLEGMHDEMHKVAIQEMVQATDKAAISALKEERKEASIKLAKVDGKIGSGRKQSYSGTMLWPVSVGEKIRLTRSDSTKHKKFKTSEVVRIVEASDNTIVFETRHGTKYEAMRH